MLGVAEAAAVADAAQANGGKRGRFRIGVADIDRAGRGRLEHRARAVGKEIFVVIAELGDAAREVFRAEATLVVLLAKAAVQLELLAALDRVESIKIGSA